MEKFQAVQAIHLPSLLYYTLRSLSMFYLVLSLSQNNRVTEESGIFKAIKLSV